MARSIGLQSMALKDAGSEKVPLYLMGSDSLSAELKMLETRKNDDPFIPGLRDLQERLQYLQTIKLAQERVRAFRWDQKAIPPVHPVKPKRSLVIALSLLMGLMMGIMIVFLQERLDKERMEAG